MVTEPCEFLPNKEAGGKSPLSLVPCHHVVPSMKHELSSQTESSNTLIFNLKASRIMNNVYK